MKNAQEYSVMVSLLDDQEVQSDRVSRKVWTRPQIRRNSEDAFCTIFQHLTTEDSDGLC